ncbi:ribosomal protein L17 [Terfezia boudieri ATCC MYA-4762]|uniref:Large ribosomal subunit protein bL17m n=1 Tax=Terfezia boudieri ATCC MYA-4762 TaxID=1051890 RepID=A0A3N4LJ33_9PEZI|nr:ribosomal protein L17 [Terfezia boudieri ATCC MYA-4762]
MTGAKLKYRHLGRDSAARVSLLRNLVTSLIEHESIETTYPKAKEAARIAEHCITLAKRGGEAARTNVMKHIFRPNQILPKLFGPIVKRYSDRPGGYTRVLRTEPKDKSDQAPSAILELVDGPRDMKFAIIAMTIARCRREGKALSPRTVDNIEQVTKFRKHGQEELKALVERYEKLKRS